MNYYRKEIPESAVIVNGVSMRFDILETQDPVLVAELNKCIARGVGGVVSISKEEFDEEVKKKASGMISGDSSKLHQRRQELSANQLGAARAAGGGFANPNGQFAAPQITAGREHTPFTRHGFPTNKGPSPDPIEVPDSDSMLSTFSKPPTGRMRRAARAD